VEQFPPGVYRRADSDILWIAYTFNGVRYRESSGQTDPRKAAKYREERIAECIGLKGPVVRLEKVPFSELLEAVVWDYQVNQKKSLGKVEERIRLHIAPRFGRMRAASVTTDRIIRYIQERQDEGASNGTINRELAIIRRAFRLGARHTPPKVGLIPHVPLLREAAPRPGFVEPGDFAALVESLPEYLRGFVTFAYRTGWRVSEIRDLKWSQVDRKERIICLHDAKDPTGKGAGRILYLDDVLLAIVEEQWTRRKGRSRVKKNVFPGHDGTGPVRDFRGAWAAACQKAGIGRRLFHDLRRSAVRNMVRAGVPERVARQISGHKTRAVFDRYNIVSEKDLADAAQKQAEYLATQPSTPKVRNLPKN